MDLIEDLYIKKIQNFCDIKILSVKSDSFSREDGCIKKVKDTQKILEKISKEDFVILCDEGGEELSSEKFSTKLMQNLELHKKVVMIIGGAFGVSEELMKRSQSKLKLSSFVLNHHIAKIVLLEQVYRAFAIERGLPYHNE